MNHGLFTKTNYSNLFRFPRLLSWLLLFFGFISNGWGNNIQVSNLSLVDENRLESYVSIKFNLTWENSWRLSSGAANWDAAWIFVKYRIGTGEWQHANLHNSGHVTGTGTPSTLSVGLQDNSLAYNMSTNPGVGVYLYRSSASSGTFTTTDMKLRWNYGSDGINSGTNVDIKVFAVEMVYVPEGSFNVGGGTGTNAFTSTTINTAVANTAPSGTGSLGGQAGGYPTNQTPPDFPSWPNGYAAFYCMKYEISQQQYTDFLNTLTQDQANARKPASSSNRFGIMGSSVGSYTTSFPDVACNYLSWADGAAYADWAALRPMTELEYEKASRGNIAAVSGEYAWGASTIASNLYTLSGSGASNEGIATNYSTTAGNAAYTSTMTGGIDGPVRVGIFAANASNIARITAGASFWGIMELSGNVWERCVTLGNAQGKIFTGKLGDGQLATDGTANTALWPDGTANGSGFRGGSWEEASSTLRISDRTSATVTNTAREADFGFRAVRN